MERENMAAQHTKESILGSEMIQCNDQEEKDVQGRAQFSGLGSCRGDENISVVG